jgi:hypothetical protein
VAGLHAEVATLR